MDHAKRFDALQLSNERGDFFFHCISYPLLIGVIKNNLDDENYNLESNYSRKVLSWYQLKLLHFSQVIYKIVSYVQDFVPFKFFF